MGWTLIPYGGGGKAGNALSETPKGGITLLKVCPQCPPPQKKKLKDQRKLIYWGEFLERYSC